jgi:hypothetical protein
MMTPGLAAGGRPLRTLAALTPAQALCLVLLNYRNITALGPATASLATYLIPPVGVAVGGPAPRRPPQRPAAGRRRPHPRRGLPGPAAPRRPAHLRRRDRGSRRRSGAAPRQPASAASGHRGRKRSGCAGHRDRAGRGRPELTHRPACQPVLITTRVTKTRRGPDLRPVIPGRPARPGVLPGHGRIGLDLAPPRDSPPPVAARARDGEPRLPLEVSQRRRGPRPGRPGPVRDQAELVLTGHLPGPSPSAPGPRSGWRACPGGQ